MKALKFFLVGIFVSWYPLYLLVGNFADFISSFVGVCLSSIVSARLCLSDDDISAARLLAKAKWLLLGAVGVVVVSIYRLREDHSVSDLALSSIIWLLFLTFIYLMFSYRFYGYMKSDKENKG